MRIALLSEAYPPDVGGLAVSAERLARGLAARGVDVAVFSRTADRAAVGIEQTMPGVPLVQSIAVQRHVEDTLTSWFDALLAAHERQPFELLHGYYLTQAGFLAAYAGRYLGIPAVASARGNDLDRSIFDPARAAHIFYALRESAAITANSHDLARKAQALAPGCRVVLTPNGVDPTLFQPGQRNPDLARQLGIDGLPVLGFVGEARAKKGLAPLLLAFRTLAAQRPLALLLVGGARSGADSELLTVFQRQNPELRLVVVPPLPHAALPPYYHLIDLLLLPSQRDGLPNALLEGMACALPIVASAAGGITDALRDTHNGLLVPPGDVAALVQAIERLLGDPALAARLGQAARQTAQRDYTPEIEIARVLDVYRSIQ